MAYPGRTHQERNPFILLAYAFLMTDTRQASGVYDYAGLPTDSRYRPRFMLPSAMLTASAS